MSRKDAWLIALWCAAALALLAPVWARPGAVFFNHGDLYAYHAPLRLFGAGQLQEGHFPFWNPYVILGVPHAANPQSALFYPPTLASFLFPVAPALVWDQVFHVLWAGLGMLLLARAQGLDRGSAAVLASGFALSPFLVYRITAGIPTLLSALSWAPWLWLAWLSRRPALLAAGLALQLFSGHGQFLVVNAVGMGLWGLLRDGRRELLRELALAALGSAALAALQWAPTAEFLRHSVRADWDGAASLLYTVSPAALWTWIWPAALGAPGAGWNEAISEFFETCGGHAGPVALALAAWGALRGKRRLGAAALILLGVVMALGPRSPAGALLSGLPVLSWLRTPARWLLLALWGVLLLAGSGAKALGAAPARLRSLAAVAAFAGLAAWDWSFLRPEDAALYLAPRAETAERVGGLRTHRVITDPELANPNKLSMYRVRNVNGYEAFYLAGVPSWAAAAEGAPAADASRVFISRWPSERLARAGVWLRLHPDGWSEDKGVWPAAFFLDENGRRAGDMKSSMERPGRWRVRGVVPPGAELLALSEPLYPGWSVRLNGAPGALAPWDGLFMGARLPEALAPGTGLAATFDFVPTHWLSLLLISGAAWTFWLARLAAEAEPA